MAPGVDVLEPYIPTSFRYLQQGPRYTLRPTQPGLATW